MLALITTLHYVRLLMHLRGYSPAGLKGANCHVVEKAMWQGTGSQPFRTEDLITQPQGNEFSQQPMSLEENPEAQVGSQL